MPRSSCEVCCQPEQLARQDDSTYRGALLRAMCDVITAIQEGEGAATVYQQGTAAGADDDGTSVLFVRRDTPAAVADDGDFIFPSANSFGAQRVDVNYAFQSSPATSLLKLEDTAHASGDAGVMPLGVINTDPSTGFGGATGEYSPNATNLLGVLYSNIDFRGQASTPNGILKREDDAHVSGDAGVFNLAIRNVAGAVFAGTDGDYSGIAVNARGGIYTEIQYDNQGSTALGILKREDDPHASFDAGVFSLLVREDTIASSNANGDYGAFKSDSVGALYTTPGTQAAVWTHGIVAGGSVVTGSFLEVTTNATRGRILRITNKTDVATDISFDGTNVAFRLSSLEEVVIDLGPSGRHMAGNVYFRAVSANGTTGYAAATVIA